MPSDHPTEGMKYDEVSLDLGPNPPTPAIYAALAEIHRSLEPIAKAQKVSFGNTRFNFRGIDDVQTALNPLLKKHRVVIACTSRKVTPLGEKYLLLEAVYAFLSLEDGSMVETVSTALATQRDDRSLSAAGSTAYKYALFELFCIPVEGVGDNDQMAEEFARHEEFDAAATPEADQARALADALAALTKFGGHLPADEKTAMLERYYHVADGAALQALSAPKLIAGTAALKAGNP